MCNSHVIQRICKVKSELLIKKQKISFDVNYGVNKYITMLEIPQIIHMVSGLSTEDNVKENEMSIISFLKYLFHRSLKMKNDFNKTLKPILTANTTLNQQINRFFFQKSTIIAPKIISWVCQEESARISTEDLLERKIPNFSFPKPSFLKYQNIKNESNKILKTLLNTDHSFDHQIVQRLPLKSKIVDFKRISWIFKLASGFFSPENDQNNCISRASSLNIFFLKSGNKKVEREKLLKQSLILHNLFNRQTNQKISSNSKVLSLKVVSQTDNVSSGIFSTERADQNRNILVSLLKSLIFQNKIKSSVPEKVLKTLLHVSTIFDKQKTNKFYSSGIGVNTRIISQTYKIEKGLFPTENIHEKRISNALLIKFVAFNSGNKKTELNKIVKLLIALNTGLFKQLTRIFTSNNIVLSSQVNLQTFNALSGFFSPYAGIPESKTSMVSFLKSLLCRAGNIKTESTKIHNTLLNLNSAFNRQIKKIIISENIMVKPQAAPGICKVLSRSMLTKMIPTNKISIFSILESLVFNTGDKKTELCKIINSLLIVDNFLNQKRNQIFSQTYNNESRIFTSNSNS